jgi:hypothetical protein
MAQLDLLFVTCDCSGIYVDRVSLGSVIPDGEHATAAG